jgi:GNAT superfamily N-acetyltransferase
MEDGRPVLRRVGEDDLDAVQDLLEADPGYSLRVDGRPPGPEAARELLEGAPPDVAPDRKVLLGVHRGDGLVAIIDLVRGWPQPDVAHIGLLQVHAQHKGRGIGAQSHDLLLDRVRSWPEIRTLRAAIVETNAAEAAPFWLAMGYTRDATTRPYRAGAVETTVSIWTRSVSR